MGTSGDFPIITFTALFRLRVRGDLIIDVRLVKEIGGRVSFDRTDFFLFKPLSVGKRGLKRKKPIG